MVQEMARSPISKHSTLFHPITGILSILTNMMAIPSQKLAKNSNFNEAEFKCLYKPPISPFQIIKQALTWSQVPIRSFIPLPRKFNQATVTKPCASSSLRSPLWPLWSPLTTTHCALGQSRFRMDHHVLLLENSTAAAKDGLRARIQVLSIDLVEPEPGASTMARI
jgi:hypothetical protein